MTWFRREKKRIDGDAACCKTRIASSAYVRACKSHLLCNVPFYPIFTILLISSVRIAWTGNGVNDNVIDMLPESCPPDEWSASRVLRQGTHRWCVSNTGGRCSQFAQHLLSLPLAFLPHVLRNRAKHLIFLWSASKCDAKKKSLLFPGRPAPRGMACEAERFLPSMVAVAGPLCIGSRGKF